MRIAIKRSKLFVVLFLFSSLLTSCITTTQTSNNYDLPVLSQDELIRPYRKLGRIKVIRETFSSNYSLTPDIKAWGLAAVRQEADKMGADAIMLMEITGRTTSYGIFPSTEYIATGYAIKFE